MSYSYWRADSSTSCCESCYKPFTTFLCRRHHCRDCGGVFCKACTTRTIAMPHRGHAKAVRVCRHCVKFIEVKLADKEVVRVNFLENMSLRPMAPEVPLEEKALTGRRMKASLEKCQSLMCPSNDFFAPARKEELEDAEREKEEEEEEEEDAGAGTVPRRVARSGLLPVFHQLQPDQYLNSTGNANRLPQPAAWTADAVMGTLLAPQEAKPSFHRVRDSLVSAYKIAVETEPQQAPKIVSLPGYY